MRKQINMNNIIGLLVLFLALVPTPSHSELNKEAVGRFNTQVQAARKVAVNDKLGKPTTLDQHTLFNLKKINRELYCLAQNNFFEARGEPFKGKLAVAEVVMNRTEHDQFPNDPCAVIQQMTVVKTDKGVVRKRVCQFSWFCKGLRAIPLKDENGNVKPKVLKQWSDSVAAAILVYHEQTNKVVGNATHFYATKLVTPSWAYSKSVWRKKVIGNHTFLEKK